MHTEISNTTRSSPMPPPTQPGVDFEAIKQRQQAIWSAGDFSIIGTTLQIVGETLAEAADVRADENVLDVAAGNGNATLAAARRFARVTSTDYVPYLLEKGAERARAEGMSIEFKVADAENLPFKDDSFDVALSTFGAMFAPNQDQTARELLRVVRSGGRIGMANWTPEGFLGDLFRIIASYVPPPAGLKSPMQWGTEPRIVELFGPEADDIQCVRREFMFRYRSPDHWIDSFRSFYGPLNKVYAALEPDRQTALSKDITELLTRLNKAKGASLVMPGEYLEVVVTKR